MRLMSGWFQVDKTVNKESMGICDPESGKLKSTKAYVECDTENTIVEPSVVVVIVRLGSIDRTIKFRTRSVDELTLDAKLMERDVRMFTR